MSEYSFTCNSYQNDIFKGFSRLQQNAEFVDMTLAAGGHFVKVHQNIVALASPYLKDILQSALCPHPVIFLTNLTPKVLDYLLEYIYTGEVKIPKNSALQFIEACKILHICGVENFVLPEIYPENSSEPVPDVPITPVDHSYAAHITINPNIFNYHLEVNPIQDNAACLPVAPIVSDTHANGIHIEALNYPLINDNIQIISNINNGDTEINNSTMINLPINTNSNSEEHNQVAPPIELNESTTLNRPAVMPALKERKDGEPQFSISTKGSLQMILNRYMYHCHHYSCEGRKRRWRCIDYRRTHCPASVDTLDGSVTNRCEEHKHPYHDNKILKKFKEKVVFSSISNAEENLRVSTEKQGEQNAYKRKFKHPKVRYYRHIQG